MDIKDAYIQVRDYCSDLSERIDMYEVWKERHPDHNTTLYYREEAAFYEGEKTSDFESTFNPDDPQPNTADLLSAKMFAAIMTLVVDCHERMTHVPKEG